MLRKRKTLSNCVADLAAASMGGFEEAGMIVDFDFCKNKMIA